MIVVWLLLVMNGSNFVSIQDPFQTFAVRKDCQDVIDQTPEQERRSILGGKLTCVRIVYYPEHGT